MVELSVFDADSDVGLVYVLASNSTLGWEFVDLRAELEAAVGRPIAFLPREYLRRCIRDRVMAEAKLIHAGAA